MPALLARRWHMRGGLVQLLTRKLTDKQFAVLRFVIDYNEQNGGRGPAIREIAAVLERSQPAARRHIELLMNKGMLKRDLGRIRTLRATALGRQEILVAR